MIFFCIIFLLGICPTLSAALETLFTEEPKAAKISQSLHKQGANQPKEGEEQEAHAESAELQQRADELFFIVHEKSMIDLPTEQDQINDLCRKPETIPFTGNNAIKVLENPSFQELLTRADITDPRLLTAEFYQNHPILPLEQQSKFATPTIIIQRISSVADYASKKLYDPEHTKPEDLCREMKDARLPKMLVLMHIIENLGLDVVMLQSGGMQFSIKDWISLTAEGQMLICIPSNFLDHVREYSSHNTWTSRGSLLMSQDILGHILYNVFSKIIETSFAKNKHSSQALLGKMVLDMIKSSTQETSTLLSPFVWPMPTHCLTAALCYDLLHEGFFCAPIQSRQNSRSTELDALIFKNEGCVTPGKHTFLKKVFLPFMKEYMPLQDLYISHQKAAMEVAKEWLSEIRLRSWNVNPSTFPSLVIRAMKPYIWDNFDNTQETADMLEEIAHLLKNIAKKRNVYMSLHPRINGVVFGTFSNAEGDISIYIAMPCKKSLGMLAYDFLKASLLALFVSLQCNALPLESVSDYFTLNSLSTTFEFLLERRTVRAHLEKLKLEAHKKRLLG